MKEHPSTLPIPIRQKAPEDRLIHHGFRLERLGLLKTPFPVILVGGTNGKGSTTHMIGRIFMEAGYIVGINTSPHLVKFNERVRINEIPISDASLERYLDQINSDFSDFPLGFNEYSFLAGLYAFIDHKVDIAVFEIGLGGRLDPANLMSADLSVITNIDYDHTEILGDTLEKIAVEKAGIIKQGRPLICGSLTDLNARLAIQSQADRLHAKTYWESEDFSFTTLQKTYDLPEPQILKRNAALGIQAALVARDSLPIPEEKLKTVLQQAVLHTGVPGRLQSFPWKHPLLLDVCHNPGGAEVLKNYLSTPPFPGKTYGIFAVSDTKDSEKMIQIMAPIIDFWIFPSIQGLKDPTRLKEIALKCLDAEKIKGEFTGLIPALAGIDRTLQETPGRVVIFGSFYLVGEFLKILSES